MDINATININPSATSAANATPPLRQWLLNLAFGFSLTAIVIASPCFRGSVLSLALQRWFTQNQRYFEIHVTAQEFQSSKSEARVGKNITSPNCSEAIRGKDTQQRSGGLQETLSDGHVSRLIMETSGNVQTAKVTPAQRPPHQSEIGQPVSTQHISHELWFQEGQHHRERGY